MPDRVVFYKLCHKYVDTREAEQAPAASKQIIYYSLAVGHHLGVVDCLSSILEVDYAEFERWLRKLPEGIGRQKLEGLCKWGEIEINAAHAKDLIETLDAGHTRTEPGEIAWTEILQQSLQNIVSEPALYLIARTR